MQLDDYDALWKEDQGFARVISRCRRSLKSWLLAVDCCFRGHRQLVLIIIPWISPHFSVIFTPLTRTPL